MAGEKRVYFHLAEESGRVYFPIDPSASAAFASETLNRLISPGTALVIERVSHKENRLDIIVRPVRFRLGLK